MRGLNRKVIRSENFAEDAAKFIVKIAQQSLAERGRFRIALSGGNTPRPIYSRLATENLPWDKTVFTFGDERCVPPDDEQSNYKMANETLFQPAHVPKSSILRMRGELEPQKSASEYEEQLTICGQQGNESIYRHDLILLGLGEDGHTASLFPATAALQEAKRMVVANFVPKLNSWRLTFTFPLINAARQVCFLAKANKNPELIEKVLVGDQKYPAARVKPMDGHLTWILGE